MVDLLDVPSVGIRTTEMTWVHKGQPMQQMAWRPFCECDWEGELFLKGKDAQAEAMAHHADHVRRAREEAVGR